MERKEKRFCNVCQKITEHVIFIKTEVISKTPSLVTCTECKVPEEVKKEVILKDESAIK